MEPIRLTPDEFKQVRLTLHFSQQHMADLLGVRRATLSHWEMGKDPIPYRVRDELADIVHNQIEALTVVAEGLER